VTQIWSTIKKVLKEDSNLEPAKQMALRALTKAVVAQMSESDFYKFNIETFIAKFICRILEKASGILSTNGCPACSKEERPHTRKQWLASFPWTAICMGWALLGTTLTSNK